VAGSATTTTTATSEYSTVTVPPVRKKVWVTVGDWVVVCGTGEVVVVDVGRIDVVDDVVGGTAAGIVNVVVGCWLSVGDAAEVGEALGVPPDPLDCD